MDTRKGFTLVELAITLVIVGLLLGMGASLFGILVKQKKYRENKDRLKENAATLVQYALEHRGRLPDNCTAVLRYPKDAYGKPFLCLIAPELKVYSACARRTTSLRVMDQEAGANHENVAFTLVSGGKNYNIQTRATSPVTIYPFEKDGVDDYPDDFNRPEPYDDQVHYLLLAELKEKLLCHRSEERLRILNETLPEARVGESYNATIYADGGVPFVSRSIFPGTGGGEQYEWCVEGRLPGGMRLECATLTNNCASISWRKCGKAITLEGRPISGTGTYKLTFYVRDADGNEAEKSLVLTVLRRSGGRGSLPPIRIRPIRPRPLPLNRR